MLLKGRRMNARPSDVRPAPHSDSQESHTRRGKSLIEVTLGAGPRGRKLSVCMFTMICMQLDKALERNVGSLPDEVSCLRAQLLALPLDVTDRDRVTALRGLADLTNAISAVQARLIHDLSASQAAADDAADVPWDRRRGVTGRVATALRESPRNAQITIGVAKALVREMPHTLNALAGGTLTWYRARLLVAETACLSLADRHCVDRQVCGDPGSLEGVGSRRLAARARRAGYELDPVSAVRRAAKAENDRYVSLRPAPDCMTWLTALLPVAQGVACFAALKAAAASGVARGDGRGVGQLMADTLVTRVTGQASADAVPLGLHLVMTDTALLTGDCEPGRILGHGPIPAALARRLVTASPAVASWVKRLYEAPTGLVATESRSRCFPEGLAELITIRDDTCATPWCDAPIRHIDHITPWSHDGPTALSNGQGLCAQCNLEKQDRRARSHAASDLDVATRGRQRAPAQAQIGCVPAA